MMAKITTKTLSTVKNTGFIFKHETQHIFLTVHSIIRETRQY